MDPRWNDCERQTYIRLVGNSQGKSAHEVATSLADLAVTEMCNARIADDMHKARERKLYESIAMMASGISSLERMLGMDIHEIAQDDFTRKIEEMRKKEEHQ